MQIMNVTNATRLYSPITLNREWSTLGRLVTIVFASCFGATVNGYFISSFFIDHELRRIGNVYHACVGLADMVITAGVLPIAAAVLLSGEWDTISVCHALQTMTATSTYCYSIFFTLVAAETYARVFHARIALVSTTVNVRIGVVVILVMCVGTALGISGTYLKLDYDYCQRLHRGSFYFRLGTSAIVHGTCCILTLYALIASSIQIRRHNRIRSRYQRCVQFQKDFSMIKLNIIAYFMYVFCWVPYLIVVNYYPDASDGQYYHTMLIGVCRALFTSVYYGSLHGAFGRAYSNIFFYCCCKTSLHTYPPRQRRITENSSISRPVVSDVRTHIMQHAVNANSPPRASTSAFRETIEL